MATIAERLAEAEAAQHELLSGKAVREIVDQNGEKIAYQGANPARLAQYIDSLRAEIAGTTVPMGPMRVFF